MNKTCATAHLQNSFFYIWIDLYVTNVVLIWILVGLLLHTFNLRNLCAHFMEIYNNYNCFILSQFAPPAIRWRHHHNFENTNMLKSFLNKIWLLPHIPFQCF